MTGEKNLAILLRSMEPTLNEGEFVFCRVDASLPIDLQEVLGTFLEKEGRTVIISREVADKNGWSYSFVAAWITLQVHSALDAVGLTAAFAAALTKEGISCNVVAGFHHDHLFVATNDAEKAMKSLRELSQSV